jgi:copper chaperone
MATQTFQVTGMSCEHCVDAVTAEVSQLAGVTAVDVDLAAGSVTVTSAQPLSADAMAAAIDEAGYQLTP